MRQAGYREKKHCRAARLTDRAGYTQDKEVSTETGTVSIPGEPVGFEGETKVSGNATKLTSSRRAVRSQGKLLIIEEP